MRKRHWLAGLLSGWLSLVGGQAYGQSPPGAQGNAGNPDYSGSLPSPYNSNYATYPTANSGTQAGYPPGATAWPNITPYGGPLQEQTANENGMWFRSFIQGNRKYYFNVEGLWGHTNIPNATIGAPGVNETNLPASILPVGSLANNTSQFQQTAAGTSLLDTPDRQLSNSGGTTSSSSSSGTTNGTTGGGVPVFATQTSGEIPNMLTTGGIRGTWGWWNPDDSGFQASAWILNQVHSTLDIADPNGFNPTTYQQLTNATDNIGLQQFILNELHASAGIPLGGADTDHNGLAGVVQPFDMYYILKYTSQVGGFNADWFTAPIYQQSAFKIRPAFGARYLTVRENMAFAGADSGLGYEINSNADSTGTTNGSSSGTSSNGTSTSTIAGNLSPVAGSLEAGVPFAPMYSTLNSTVTSQLAGPEAGLRFDFGKEKFNIFTTSKLGLLVNYSTRQLNGYNIGDAYYPATNGTIANPTVMPRPTPYNTLPNNTFSSSNTSTTLSPMFEQGIFAKANVFQFIPYLNRSSILSTAELQIGYTVIFVGGMSRPASDVNWQAYPVNPSLTNYKQTFFTENYSFGLQWNY